MADEDKTKKVDAKVADIQADAPKPAQGPAQPIADPGKLSPADVQLIGHVAAQVVAQSNSVAGRAPSRIPGSDSTVKGGKYLVDGSYVNAWGEPFKEGEDGTADNPERRRI